MYAWVLVLCVFFALYMFKKSSPPPFETQEELEAFLLQLKNLEVESSRDSKNKKFEKASRFAINDQIRQFKTAAFRYHSTLLCPLTNEIINERNCHVDHIAPLFKQLKQEFIEHNNIDVNTVEFRSDINGNVHFEDDEIRAAFETFHRERATLRVTSVNGNSNREKIEKKRVECKNHPVIILEDKNNSLLEAFGYTSKLSTRLVSELFLKK